MGSKRTKEKKKADKPSFDKTALAQLTSKIDKSLADSEKQRPPKRKRTRDNQDEHDTKRRQTRPAERDAPTDLGGGPKNKQSSILLDEILALGGNEDDLELVANVDSGDEGGEAPRPKVSSEPPVDKSLRDELSQFASSLGFSKFRQDEDPETDGESEAAEEGGSDDSADEGNDDEGEEEDDEEEDEEDNEPTPRPQEVQQGKQSGKLASKQVRKVSLAVKLEHFHLTWPRPSNRVLTGTDSRWMACLHGLRATTSSIRLPYRT
jgi:ribosome biogenesis protein MAK21